MDPVTGAWQIVYQQGPLFAFMAIVIYFGAKYIRGQQDKSDTREADREKRYNELVDKMLNMQSGQVQTLTEALSANTAVMERVERKLG